jgi:3-deoxy-7-phosphoheptulonate synthase
MVVAMHSTATEEEIQAVIARMQDNNLHVHLSTGTTRTVIGAIGETHTIELKDYQAMGGVAEVVRISEPYKMSSRSFRQQDTIINVGKVVIGGSRIVVMAGPCAVESLDQTRTIAEHVARAGATMLRGGAFKPRSSPYAFSGLGEKGLEILRTVADEFDLAVVTEVMDRADLDLVCSYTDMIQLGARNMQNFTLLRELGRVSKPVLLKRGLSATYEEWLMSAEYILSNGNEEVVLCERGIRTFESYTRNTLDIAAIPVMKKLTHLPIISDPSHGTGRRDKVLAMARASVAAGADGLMIEVHHDPDHAASDGAQSLYPDQFAELMKETAQIVSVVGREV